MAKTIINKENLAEWLDKFFDGNTTNAEDKALEEYFRTSTDVPKEFECYRDMFGWYSSGLDEAELPVVSGSVDRPKRRFQFTTVLKWSSIAAAIAVAIGIGWVSSPQKHESSTLYAENYIVRDGRMITGMDEIKDDIMASVIEGDCLEKEIDMNIKMLNNEQIEE